MHQFLLKNFYPWKSCMLLWRFFLLQILLETLDVTVLEESSLVQRISKTFLVDLKMSSKLMECFEFVWFCMFCLANIWQKVLEHFSHSGSLLIPPQIFAPFDCLHYAWCNLSCKFSVNGLNFGKFLSLYLGLFSQKRMEHVFF